MDSAKVMMIAGEPSGDFLGAQLVTALRQAWQEMITTGYGPTCWHSASEPYFFGAGGPKMTEAGADVLLDMTSWSAVGLTDVILSYRRYKNAYNYLLSLATKIMPDLVICIDFSGFNLRFAKALRQLARQCLGPIRHWRPVVIQYVSPQLWASRPGRLRVLERYVDLVVSIFPFEKEWYRVHNAAVQVEYFGHPFSVRYGSPAEIRARRPPPNDASLVVLLPGSRKAEFQRHVPLLLQVWRLLKSELPGLSAVTVVPSQHAQIYVSSMGARQIPVQVGGLSSILEKASLALACTGTVTLECAWHCVPAVTFYRTSWITYHLGKRLIRVSSLTMPNILSGETIYPEFIQHQATPERLAQTAIAILKNPVRQMEIQDRLEKIMMGLYNPDCLRQAANLIWTTAARYACSYQRCHRLGKSTS